MSNYNYGGSNPFDQRGGNDGYGQGGYNNGGSYNQGGYGDGAGGYSQGGYAQQGGYGDGAGGYSQGGSSNVEMSFIARNAILTECANIKNEISELEKDHEELKALHKRAASETEPDSKTNNDITELLNNIRNTYHGLGDRLKNLASKPESQSDSAIKRQVDTAKRSLKRSVQAFVTLQAALEQNKTAEAKRQYKIVHPQASDDDAKRYADRVRNGQDPNQLFQTTLLTGADQKLSALKARNEALQNIEKQMAELLELFTQMDTLVMQQDVAIANIEQKAEEVVDNLDKGNEEIGTAVETARATRRKKWWCLGIFVAIILVIVIIVVVYMAVNGKFNSSSNNNNSSTAKRSVLLSHIHGGPRPLVTDRSGPISRIARRNYVLTGETTADTIKAGGAVDLSKRDGPLIEKLARSIGV